MKTVKALIKQTETGDIFLDEFNIPLESSTEEIIKETVDYFNSTLREEEAPREFVSLQIRNKKVIYFADPFDPPEEEVERIIIDPLRKAGISFEKIKCTETPPFGEKYDILFFDWGGMSMGNSLLESFCREIIKEAEDYPSRIYVMISTFTKQAMEDALNTLRDITSLPNIYLNINSFIKDFNILIINE